MKKIITLILLGLLIPVQSMFAQETEPLTADVVEEGFAETWLEVVEERVSYPFELQLFKKFEIPVQTDYPDLTFVKSENLYIRGYAFDVNTYKTPDNTFVCEIHKDDNNFLWYIPKMTQNAITGENEPIVKEPKRDIGGRVLLDDFGIAFYGDKGLYANMKTEGGYVITRKFKYNPIGYKWFDLQNIKDQKDYKWKKRDIWGEFTKGFNNTTYGTNESAKETLNNTDVELHISLDETVPLSITEFYSWGSGTYYMPIFRKDYADYFIDYIPEVTQLNAKLYLEPSCYVPLSKCDRIKSVSKEGKIITVLFENPDDFIKYTTFSHGVFDGHLTRNSGYFVLKNDKPSSTMRGTYHMTSPVTVEHQHPYDDEITLGRVTIPAGCYTGEIPLEENLMGDLETNRAIFFDGKASPFVYDENGEYICRVSGRGDHSIIDYKDGYEMAQKLEADQNARIKKEEAEALAGYKQKYGAANVDAVMQGKLKIGMPWALVNEAFPNSVWDQNKYSTIYKLVNNEPHLNRSAKKIEKVNYGFGQLIYVTVQNGKITDLFYTGHK